jgi:hypothetical protein
MIYVDKEQTRMTELWQQYLITYIVVNTVGRGEGKKGDLVLVLLNLFFGCTLVLACPEGGAFPFRLSSRVWRHAAGGTALLTLRRAFLASEKEGRGVRGRDPVPSICNSDYTDNKKCNFL